MSNVYLNDIDPQFIKAVSHMYSSEYVLQGNTVPLQYYLEQAIKSKSGIEKDFTELVNDSFKNRRLEEFKPFVSSIDDKENSDDDELELDLFKEDLMCTICKGMDVGARNRLLECSDCHMLYHQECHKPPVTNQDSFDTWTCTNCKENKKKTDFSAISANPSSVKLSSFSKSSSSSPSSNSSTSSTSSHRHGSSSSYKTSSSVSKTDKYSKSSGVSSSKSGSSPKPTGSNSSSSSSSRSNVTPNINIVSADKRIQIMKKKAAKKQEQRKHTSR